MATVKQTITLDASEADQLKAALGGRVVEVVLQELRGLLNAPAQPETDDGGGTRQTVVTKIRPGHEVTSALVSMLDDAVQQRIHLLQTLSDLLGSQAVHTAEVLQAHREAADVLAQITAQLEPADRELSGSLA